MYKVWVIVALKNTALSDPEPYLERISYNAKGQKILAAYGNGIMTRYLYRSDNFRLLRMKSEGYDNSLDPLVYVKQSGTTRQNYSYEYDLSGNIISITDTTTGCGVGGSDELVREFEYDALYRLLSATGRETAGTAVKPWKDTYRPNDNTQSRAYTQHYEYDKLGNIKELQHLATSGNFTRAFSYITDKNKLDTIEIGANTYSFTHDVNGNIIQEDTSRHFAYDYADRLKAFYIQTSTEEPSTYTQYFYDAGGNRVKKISRVQGGGSTRTTVYIDGVFEHTIAAASDAIPDLEIGSWVIGYGTGEQNTLHIMDGSSRIATMRVGDALGDTTPDVKYNLEDHLGSSNLTLSTDGALVSSEEYYPFGETSFGSYGKKRYRFCGKEKDEESGLYYYGLRYYNPYTCRFINIDPLAAKYPFYTPYQYAGNKPINKIDIDGAEENGNVVQGGDVSAKKDNTVVNKGPTITPVLTKQKTTGTDGDLSPDTPMKDTKPKPPKSAPGSNINSKGEKTKKETSTSKLNNLNQASKLLDKEIDSLIGKSQESGNNEFAGAITTTPFPDYNTKTNTITNDTLYRIENIDEGSIDHSTVDPNTVGKMIGDVHTHVNIEGYVDEYLKSSALRGQPPSPQDVLRLEQHLGQEGFFSIIETNDIRYALVLENSELAKKFFAEHSNLKSEVENYMLELKYNTGEDYKPTLEREALIHFLEGSGLGFYEMNKSFPEEGFQNVKTRIGR